jgi:DNA-directed RNA polymerase subunit RPC12/RpoP
MAEKCIVCDRSFEDGWAKIDGVVVCEECLFRLVKSVTQGPDWNWVRGDCLICECEYEGAPVSMNMIVCKECLFDLLSLYFDTDGTWSEETEEAETEVK